MQLKEISFEIIQRCPNNCIYCSSNSNNNSKYIINYDVFKRTIDDGIELGLSRVCISGGEPFLHPDIFKFVDYAKGQNLEVFIYTSGITYNNLGEKEPLNGELLNKLNKIGLDKLIFNVQSSDESVYDSIMGTSNCFNLMQTSIKNCVDCNLFCEFHIVPMKKNYYLIDSILEMAQKLGANKVSFLRLVIQGRALQNRHMIELSDSMNNELKSKLSLLGQRFNDIEIRVGIPLAGNGPNECNASIGKLIIRYDGAVYPCEAFKYINVIDGNMPDNINVSSLREIYNKSKFLNMLKTEIKEFRTQKMNCENCPAQWRLTRVVNN